MTQFDLKDTSLCKLMHILRFQQSSGIQTNLGHISLAKLEMPLHLTDLYLKP
jgi:hypothetical protein